MQTTENYLNNSTGDLVFQRGLVMALLSVRCHIEFGVKSRGVLDSNDLSVVDQMMHIFNSSPVLRNMLTTNETKHNKKCSIVSVRYPDLTCIDLTSN